MKKFLFLIEQVLLKMSPDKGSVNYDTLLSERKSISIILRLPNKEFKYLYMSNKGSDNLFRLIKSLNSSEKRYFKLYATRHSSEGKNNYVTLFNAIDNQKEYDEIILLSKFKKESFTNSFSISKARLYETILKSLDAFHANSSMDARLRRELHWAEILYKKTLYDQCIKQLSSTKKIAEKYERHSIILQILQMEKLLMEKDNYSGKTDEEIVAILEEDRLVEHKQRNFNEFWNLKSRLFMLLNKHGKVRNKEELQRFKKIIDNTLLKQEEEALSLEARYLFHHIYSAYYFATGDYNKSYKHLEKNLKHIESNTIYFKQEPNIYFSVLTNIIYIASQLKKFPEVFMFLEKLRDIPETLDTKGNEDLEVKLFSSSLSIELTLHVQTGDFEKAVALIPEIDQGLKKFEGRINPLRKGYFYLNIAISLFGVEKYNLALKYLNKIINDPQIEESQDLYCIARILNLIIHIELHNDELIPYSFRSTLRFLNTRNRVYKFETVFLDFISDICKLKNEKRLPEIYSSLEKKLLEIKKDTFEKPVFEYFDFISWAQGKKRKVPFGKIVAEKNMTNA